MEKKERYEIHIYDDVCVDLYNNGVLDKSINDTYKLEKLLNQQDKENQQLKQQLEEKEKTIQSYEKIVEQKDEEIRFANRDKIYIVKQLNDPKDYVLLEDYKKVEQQLAEKDKTIANIIEDSKTSKELLKKQLEEKDADIIALDTDNYSFKQQIDNLRQQLKSQPAEIVEKIRNICSIEDKCKDGSFVLGINEKDLDNLLKEYQK